MLARTALLFGLLLATQLSGAEPPITAAAFAKDGRSLVVGSQRGLHVYSWPYLAKLRSISTRLQYVHDLRLSPNNQVLAAVGGSPAEDGRIELIDWPASEHVQTQTVGPDVLYRVSWHSSGERLVVAGPDRRITRLDKSGKVIGCLEGHSRDVVAVTFLPNGHFVSGSRDNTIRIWEHSSANLVRTLNNHTDEIIDLAVRPTSTSAPYVIASSSADHTVRFWWPIRGRLMRFAKLPSPALDIEWTPDGDRLVVVCEDGHLRVVDPDTVEVSMDVEVGSSWLYTLAIAPDGGSAFVGGADGLMQVVKIR
ncbi:MAG: hypothetical protein H6822_31415 [Planctomycetaceae bacterium]|nr:hypothetical protein [Planctomycetales bacterium]MCB9926690.1 hypothetical protein [Planctomycetaceae bacterium]